MRECRKCGFSGDNELFVKSSESKDGRRALCKLCNNAYYAQRRIDKYDLVRSYEKKFHRDRRLKHTFGINEEIYQNMLVKQNYKCAICTATKSNARDDRLSVDHCHTTGKVRGLLCGNCNTGLGQFKDNKELLKKAIEYLD